MGYTTDFRGEWEVTPPLSQPEIAYLTKFAQTRRMRRDIPNLVGMPDPERYAVGLDFGRQGEYFVGGTGDFGQDHDVSIVDHNRPPNTQPGLWCQWVPTEDGKYIKWDGGEKFYHYIEWIMYLIENFLEPWGHTLNGVVEWRGEEGEDTGSITIINNKVSVNGEDPT